jgi:threonine 3-dehydrogenase
MKALRKLYSKPGLWLDEVPKPTVGARDVLVQIHHTAICGTDLHIYNWDDWAQSDVPVPMTVGHEFMGTIVALGEQVQGYQIGDRVSGEGHLVCGICRNCRTGSAHVCADTKGIGRHAPGAFAEFMVLPAENVYRLPEDMPDVLGAILDPLGNAVHTALSFDLIGEAVLITGAGPIGIMAAKVAKHVGAKVVVLTDINPNRLALAAQMTDAITVNVAEENLSEVQHKLRLSDGFGVGLEMSGSAHALASMINTLRPGGQIALLGILPNNAPVDWQKIIFKGIMLKGIYGREMYQTWYKMVAMLQGGLEMQSIITHHFPYTEFESGFKLMNSGLTGKVILHWR